MKYINTLYHSVLVGIIAALAVFVSHLLDIKAWIVFFAWANYFLHNCNITKSMKMLLALFVGVILAYIATFPYNYLVNNMEGMSAIYISVFVVFCMATLLIFLEVIKNWGEFVPATFLGTVLYYASEVNLQTVFGKLFIPLLIGIIAGYLTIFSRDILNKILDEKASVTK